MPIHQQVVYAVVRAVVTGQMLAGDAFPSVRVLSQELGINPNTAHKIIATLTADGVLTVHPGIGTVISARWSEGHGGQRGLIEDDVERLVVESRRAGLSLHDVLAAVRRHWSRTIRRTG